MSATTLNAAQLASNGESGLGTTVGRNPGTVTPTKHTPMDDRHALLLSLPPPPPFDLSIEDISIGVPPPQHFLPLPVSIPVPSFLLGANKHDNSDKTIIRNVSVSCGSGEILALCVFYSSACRSTIDKYLWLFSPQDRWQWKRKIHAVNGNSESSCKPSNKIRVGLPTHHESHCRWPRILSYLVPVRRTYPVRGFLLHSNNLTEQFGAWISQWGDCHSATCS